MASSPPDFVTESIKRMSLMTPNYKNDQVRDGDCCEVSARLFIPGLTDGLRVLPNHVARSSLFAPVARGKRTKHDGVVMVTRSDCVMTYSGQQLDEADADLYMQLFQLAQGRDLGQPLLFTTYSILKEMGKGTGSQQYSWLRRRMKALTSATLFIETKNKDGSIKYSTGAMESFHLVDKFGYDSENDSWIFVLDPRWVKLFGGREFSLIDWDKRIKIKRGKDIAKTLQRLFAASSDPIQRYSLNWLKEKMQYASPMSKFKKSLLSSVYELKRLEIISDAKIEKSTRGKEQLTIKLSV